MNDKQSDEVIGTYGGDAFGNGAMTMLRCRQCTGLYIKAPDLQQSYAIGLILFDDDGRGRRRHESKLADIYAEGPECLCHNTEVDVKWAGLWNKRIARPPMHEFEWEGTVDSPGRLFKWGMSRQESQEEGSREDDSE